MTASSTERRPPAQWLDQVPRYVAGLPAPEGGLSLASNESQHGCSPAALAALHALPVLAAYPAPFSDALRSAIAELHDVPVDQVLVGNGSDELVQLIAQACVGHGGRVVAAAPGYAMNRITALVVDARYHPVALRGWRHDLPAMAAAAGDVTYVVNPHNPTGTICDRSEIESAARETPGLTVVDEAYVDFADHAAELTAMPLARRGQVAVLRTFSKVHGLAALRVGYLVGPAALVDRLTRARAPFSVNAAAQAAARAALDDRDFVEAHVGANRRNRAALESACRRLGLEPLASQANFVLVPTDDEAGIVHRLRSAGVSVRAGGTLGVPGAIRVTVPNDRDLPRLLDALEAATSPQHGADPATLAETADRSDPGDEQGTGISAERR